MITEDQSRGTNVQRDQKTVDTLLELKQLLQIENEHLYQQYNHLMIRNQKLMKRIDDQQMLNDKLQQRIEGLENMIERLRNSATTPQRGDAQVPLPVASLLPSLQHVGGEFISRWSSLAGDAVKNNPTKKRQMQILSLLHEHQKMSGLKLFMTLGITGVSGARYISSLKHFGLIEFSGFRKDGYYFITEKGKNLVEGEEFESERVGK